MTRGDGGQNLIGDEQGELLGIIRTQELLAARRIDGAEQFFSRAIDFGYTKSPQETLSIWDRDKILAELGDEQDGGATVHGEVLVVAPGGDRRLGSGCRKRSKGSDNDNSNCLFGWR